MTWAFTTTLTGHYQPISWLTWAGAARLFGSHAAVYHALGLGGHLLNVALLYVLAWRLARARNLPPATVRPAAAGAALLFGLHPLRVEAVAWASAFPYVLALGFVLIAAIAYLRFVTIDRRSWWLVVAVGACAASTFSRSIAIGFPLVLLAVNLLALGRVREIRRVLAEIAPFAAVALVGLFGEMMARDVATLEEIDAGARLTLAATAPFRYIARTIVPIRLSPLDLLPVEPRISWTPLLAGLVSLLAVTVALLRWRPHAPWIGTAWFAYLALLAPAMGLAPTGLQATADRYTYLPGVVLALVAGGLLAAFSGRLGRARLTAFASIAILAVPLGLATWRQATWWRDSITLWTRAADLDPANDVALYNLAVALSEAGRTDEAARRYRETLRLVPDHELAHHGLAALEASGLQREADELAASGRFGDAVGRYDRVIALDPSRPRAYANRGMALARLGRYERAIPDLEKALGAGLDDAALDNALALALVETGRPGEAVDVLRAAMGRHPRDAGLMQNLARLLATHPDPAVRDGREAVRLAIGAVEATSARDPRVLDTLAVAYAEAGQLELARKTAERAEALAREAGETEMADEIRARARGYVRNRKKGGT